MILDQKIDQRGITLIHSFNLGFYDYEFVSFIPFGFLRHLDFRIGDVNNEFVRHG